MRTNREILTRGDDIYARKKQKAHGVEEVKFDRDARSEYLTGFHKRKVQRQEKAVEIAKKLAHEQKLLDRKRIRDERKEDLQKDLKRFQDAMKSAFDGDEQGDEVENDTKTSDSDYSDWEGINDGPNGILRAKKIFANYDDENEESLIDSTTTVIIEEMPTSNEFHVDLGRSEKVLKQSIEKATMSAMWAGVAQEEEQEPRPAKKTKKKFRYLTKPERKMRVSKERSRHGAKGRSS